MVCLVEKRYRNKKENVAVENVGRQMGFLAKGVHGQPYKLTRKFNFEYLSLSEAKPILMLKFEVIIQKLPICQKNTL